jgi:hypothetical protein
MIIPVLKATSLLILASACFAGEFAGKSSNVAFDSVLRSTESGIRSARDQVIRDSVTWGVLWDELHIDSDPKPPLPEVDFTHQMVVVAAMGEEPTSQFNIEITRLALKRGVSSSLPILEVHITERRPRGCTVLPSATSPIHIIVTGIVNDVTFRRKRVVDRC